MSLFHLDFPILLEVYLARVILLGLSQSGFSDSAWAFVAWVFLVGLSQSGFSFIVPAFLLGRSRPGFGRFIFVLMKVRSIWFDFQWLTADTIRFSSHARVRRYLTLESNSDVSIRILYCTNLNRLKLSSSSLSWSAGRILSEVTCEYW